MKATIDTNVIVAALRSQLGASYRLLDLLPSKGFQMALTVPLYTEYQDVLTRPENMTGASTRDEILAFLRYLCSLSHRQEVYFLWRPYLRDPKDDMVLETAVASSSRYIITHNQRDFRRIDAFGIVPITPAAFLRHLGSQP